MTHRNRATQQLLEKIRELPPDKVAEIEDFVDFLRSKREETGIKTAVTRLSEQAFSKVWDNPEDAEYDAL